MFEIFGFVLIFLVCILWVLKILGAQSRFFLSSHIRFFKNLFFNQSMVFLGFGYLCVFLGIFKSDSALVGVLLVLLWGSTREGMEVRVGGGGGGGFGREE